jgi:hypothetical protein
MNQPKTDKYNFIQLRTSKCKDFGVVLQDKLYKDIELELEHGIIQTTYLDSKRAKKLAFALLSAANKLERIERTEKKAK